MLTPSQKSRLQHQHESIIEITKGWPELELRKRPETGKWSPYENMAHLAAYQTSLLSRLKKIEKEESPSFERYVAEKDPHFQDCCEMDLHQLNEYLFTQRFLISNHLSTLTEASYRRIGRHPLFGDLTITKWIDFFLLHESHHLFTIFKLLNGSRP